MTASIGVLAEGLAAMMTRNNPSQQDAPEVEEDANGQHAAFVVETPFGRIRVDLTAVD